MSTDGRGIRYSVGENRGRFVHTVTIEKLSLEGPLDYYGWKGKLDHKKWRVLHMDGCRTNNEPQNLLVLSASLEIMLRANPAFVKVKKEQREKARGEGLARQGPRQAYHLRGEGLGG